MKFYKYFPVLFDLAYISVFLFSSQFFLNFFYENRLSAILVSFLLYLVFTISTYLFDKVTFTDKVKDYKLFSRFIFKFTLLALGLAFSMGFVTFLIQLLPDLTTFNNYETNYDSSLWYFLNVSEYGIILAKIVWFLMGIISIIILFLPIVLVFYSDFNKYNEDDNSNKKILFLFTLFVTYIFSAVFFNYLFFVDDNLIAEEMTRNMFVVTHIIYIFIWILLASYPRIMLFIKMPSFINFISMIIINAFFLYKIMIPWFKII